MYFLFENIPKYLSQPLCFLVESHKLPSASSLPAFGQVYGLLLSPLGIVGTLCCGFDLIPCFWPAVTLCHFLRNSWCLRIVAPNRILIHPMDSHLKRTSEGSRTWADWHQRLLAGKSLSPWCSSSSESWFFWCFWHLPHRGQLRYLYCFIFLILDLWSWSCCF